MTYQPRQCPAYGKTYSNFGKWNHFKEVYRSTARQGKQIMKNKKPIHEIQQDEEETDAIQMMKMTGTRTKSFSFKSIILITVTKLKTSGRQKYRTGRGSEVI